MEIIVELDLINTHFNKDVPANISVKVYLNTIWNVIKQNNRVYLSTYLTIPIIREQIESIENIVLRNYFNINDIFIDDTGIYAILKGYVEGTIKSIDEIQSYCYVWSYNCI